MPNTTTENRIPDTPLKKAWERYSASEEHKPGDTHSAFSAGWEAALSKLLPHQREFLGLVRKATDDKGMVYCTYYPSVAYYDYRPWPRRLLGFLLGMKPEQWKPYVVYFHDVPCTDMVLDEPALTKWAPLPIPGASGRVVDLGYDYTTNRLVAIRIWEPVSTYTDLLRLRARMAGQDINRGARPVPSSSLVDTYDEVTALNSVIERTRDSIRRLDDIERMLATDDVNVKEALVEARDISDELQTVLNKQAGPRSLSGG